MRGYPFIKRRKGMDPEERLKKMVKDTGEVNPVYGGLEIRVLKPNLFPWYKVFRLLIEIGQEIWVNEKEGKVCIISEPKVQ
jgi:hypothetical protein